MSATIKGFRDGMGKFTAYMEGMFVQPKKEKFTKFNKRTEYTSIDVEPYSKRICPKCKDVAMFKRNKIFLCRKCGFKIRRALV